MNNKNILTVSNTIGNHHQSGMTLVELLISIVVGLFLLAGVVTNFISTKDADRSRDAVSEMDANASAAFDMLRTVIAHAGYPSIENIRMEKAFYTEGDGPVKNSTCRDGSNKIVWTETIDEPTKDLANRDKLTVVSLADNPCRARLASCANDADRNPAALVFTDCTGGGADLNSGNSRIVSCSTDSEKGMQDPTEARIYSTITLLRYPGPNDRVLSCQGSRGGTQPIANNVEAIQYLYGVTNDAGNTYYRRADQVENDDQWGMVSSVQVGLLMRSSQQYLFKTASTKKEYNLLKRKVNIKESDLHRMFRVYTTTINLENLKKAPLGTS